MLGNINVFFLYKGQFLNLIACRALFFKVHSFQRIHCGAFIADFQSTSSWLEFSTIKVITRVPMMKSDNEASIKKTFETTWLILQCDLVDFFFWKPLLRKNMFHVNKINKEKRLKYTVRWSPQFVSFVCLLFFFLDSVKNKIRIIKEFEHSS